MLCVFICESQLCLSLAFQQSYFQIKVSKELVPLSPKRTENNRKYCDCYVSSLLCCSATKNGNRDSEVSKLLPSFYQGLSYLFLQRHKRFKYSCHRLPNVQVVTGRLTSNHSQGSLFLAGCLDQTTSAVLHCLALSFSLQHKLHSLNVLGNSSRLKQALRFWHKGSHPIHLLLKTRHLNQ